MWTQCTSVADGQTDGRTDRITITKTVQRIASHGKNYTYLYGCCVYNQLQSKKKHRCQCKQMHGNYFRITTALCYLMAVLRQIAFPVTLTARSE